MEAQHDAQLGVFDETGDEAVHGAVALQPDQVRRDLQHVDRRGEGDVAQFLEPDGADFSRHGEEGAVAGQVRRGDAGDLALLRRQIGRTGDLVAIVEADAVEGRHGTHVDVVLHLLAAELPEFGEEEGRGDDGGAAIEGEAVLPQHAGAAAGICQALEHGDPVAARAEADRGSQPAEAAADDDGVRTAVGSGVGSACRRRACQHYLTVN